MARVDFPKFVEQVGLGDLASLGREEIATDFMPAAIAGLSDGDLAIMHREYTGRKAELYGESFYGEGRVAQAIFEAALRNGLEPGPIYDFQSFAAEYFIDLTTRPDSLLGGRQRYRSAVKIRPDALVIDDNRLPLDRPPRLVFDYGACLHGQGYLADQIAFLNHGRRPFTYSPLTRLHFTNQALINTYFVDYGRDIAQTMLRNQLYIGREDGVATATNEVIRAQHENGAPVEIADIILATGAQHTTREDMRRGITNAYTLLKEGGKLGRTRTCQPGKR
ncbi:hypothetical protein IRY61_02105 [Candidatus Saccharibacteria bacterium]|nr:hypothetical protein [Candidatus Saccharibacteria bacterium]